MKKCYLHIGTMKTGTTTLQNFLSGNRETLAKHGICYPKPLDFDNHTLLAAFAQRVDKIDDLRMRRGAKNTEDVVLLRQNIKKMFDEEMNSINMQKVLFSSEHLSSRLVSEDEIRSLYNLISPHFSEVEIVLYLRLQDELALSIYSTQIRTGSTEKFRIDKFKPNSQVLNYSTLLSRWENVFGKDNINIRIFDRQCFQKQSLVQNFLMTIGLSETECSDFPDDDKVQNVSYDCPSLETLRYLNSYLPRFIDKSINVNRGDIGEVFEKISIGDIKPRLSKYDAEEILKVFDESNIRVFERYGLLELYRNIRKNRGGDESTLPYNLDKNEMAQVFASAWAFKERTKKNSG
jgi:hypothetical protein